MCNAGRQLSMFGASAWSLEFTVWVTCPQRRDSHRTGAELGPLMLPSSSKDNVSASLPGPSSSPYAFFFGVSPRREPLIPPLPRHLVQMVSKSRVPASASLQSSGIALPFLFHYYRLLFTKAVGVNGINFRKYKQAPERKEWAVDSPTPHDSPRIPLHHT